MRRPALLFTLAALACACGTEKLEPRPTSDATVETGPSSKTTVFAVSFFRLGMTKWDGEPTTDAWRQYGFNLDGQCTTTADSETSKGTCKRVEMSEADTLTDGDNCIDNNFGSKLIAMIRALDPAAETKIGDGIKKGALTLILKIENLPTTGVGTGPTLATMYAGKARGTPTLDGNDVWDIDATSVKDSDLTKPLATFSGTITMVDGKRVWSAQGSELPLPAVFIAGANGAIPIKGARIDIEIDNARGMIAGYAPMTSVKSVVTGVLANQKMCPGQPLFEAVMTNIGRTADMPTTLPHNGAETCTSLSMGLGVELVGGSLGTVVPTPPPKPDPCNPDAGPKDAATDVATDVADATESGPVTDGAEDVAADVGAAD